MGNFQCVAETASPEAPVGADVRVVRYAVILNVYEADPTINCILDSLGFGGIHHSGVQIGEVEYAYGGGVGDGTGVWMQYPRTPPRGYKRLKRQIPMGYATMLEQRYYDLINHMQSEWTRDRYDVCTRNCNHFADALCRALVNSPLPQWVNRIAAVYASFRFCACALCCCGCCLSSCPPESLHPVPSSASPCPPGPDQRLAPCASFRSSPTLSHRGQRQLGGYYGAGANSSSSSSPQTPRRRRPGVCPSNSSPFASRAGTCPSSSSSPFSSAQASSRQSPLSSARDASARSAVAAPPRSLAR